MPVAALASSRARRQLDARLGPLRPVARYAPPPRGWLRAIRESLGMAQADVAARLGVTQAAVQQLEVSEQDGTIRLSSLRRVADAMGCDVAYVLLPRTSLAATVRAQAERVVDAENAAAERSMALEAQEATLLPEARERLVDELVGAKRLWRR